MNNCMNTVVRVKNELQWCPKCNKYELNRIKGTNGFFWGCSGFKNEECKSSFKDKRGKPDF